MRERIDMDALVSRLVTMGLAGPWQPIASMPAGGPWACLVSSSATVLAYTPGRLREELAGMARVPGHPALPRVLATTDAVLAFEPVAERVDDAASALSSWRGERWRGEATVREHLEALNTGTHVGRALVHAGVSRSQVDRLLARSVRVETYRGASTGPIDPSWIRRTADGRTVALRWSLARGDGWLAHALAEIERIEGHDLAAFHREGLLDDDAADAAYAIARLERIASASVRDHGDTVSRALREAVEALVPAREPSRVRVTIEGPAWLDARAWLPAGDEVPPSHARRIVRVLDGVVVAGTTVRVRVQPAIRAERGAPLFEPPDARRRRIFSRWDEGIRTDEEGLYSATPEALALWLTQDAKGTVIDGTAGIGCIAIALARNPNVRTVIAVDLDRSRLEMAVHNADVYGVRSRIRFACDDVRSVLARERSDLLVLDPPWGGPNYDRNRVALPDLGMDVASVLERAPSWVKLKLPRSFDPTSLPGAFTYQAAVDSRGVVKFLVATRGRSETAG